MDKIITNELPPCRICGEKASGIHYGVNTCEACKAFFKRSQSKKDIYECAGGRNCDVLYGNRNACAYCRFQKCIRLGMCKDAIKTGRYSYATKASNIWEIRTLESQSRNGDADVRVNIPATINSVPSPFTSIHSQFDLAPSQFTSVSSTFSTTPPFSSNPSPLTSIVSPLTLISSTVTSTTSPFTPTPLPITSTYLPLENSCANNMVNNSDTVISCSTKSFMLDMPVIQSGSSAFKSPVLKMQKPDIVMPTCSSSLISGVQCVSSPVLKLSEPVIVTPSCSSGRISDNQDACSQILKPQKPVSSPNYQSSRSNTGPAENQRLYHSSKVEVYEACIQKMYEKHKIYAGDDINICETLSDYEKEYLEMLDLRKQIFGQLSPMSAQEYLKFYEETGIDIDGRRDMLIQCLPLMELTIKQHIEFAKTIPGFTDLSVNDQIGLIKTTRSEMFLIGRHRRFCADRKIYSPFPGTLFHMDDMKKIKGSVVEPIFNMQRRINKLKLANDETAILCAICIMSTDSYEVQDPTLVEKSQHFLLECLFYLFDKHHPEEKHRFSRIIDCLTGLRAVREDNYRFEEEITNMWWGNIAFPPLVRELWTN